MSVSWFSYFVTDVSEVKELEKASMQDLLFTNGFMDNKAYFDIYQDCCWKIVQSLQGIVSHPGLILHLVLFNTDSWPEERVNRLREKHRIKVCCQIDRFQSCWTFFFHHIVFIGWYVKHKNIF